MKGFAAKVLLMHLCSGIVSHCQLSDYLLTSERDYSYNDPTRPNANDHLIKDYQNESCPKQCDCSADLTTINCKKRNLAEVPKDIPSSAIVLYLGYNSLSVLKNQSFKNLRVLRDLYLNNNKISNIETGAFGGLTSLKLLSFTNNLLTKLNEDALRNLNGLETLYLTKNKLEEIPDFGSVSVTNLTKLVIDDNHLKSANMCKGVTHITFVRLGTLVLSNNAIISLEDGDLACIDQKKLTTIKLSRNKLSIIMPNALSFFSHLQSANIAYNSNLSWQAIQNFTKSISASMELASLDLTGVFVSRDLRLNATTFSKLSNSSVRYLFLASSENIDVIESDTFSHFPKLETLDLSKGEIHEIKDLLQSSKKLKDLRLFANRGLVISFIKQLKIPTLQLLDLRQIHIDELDKNLFDGLPQLQSLSLKDCQIKKIFSDAFAGLSNLKKLDLSNNEIGGNNIPSKLFSHCQNLTDIDLSNNKMTSIATEYKLFGKLFQLKRLDLSSNNCFNISEGLFKDLKCLEYLNLEKNKLGSYFAALDNLPKLFGSLKSLLFLNLQGNEIPTLPNNIFDGLTSLRMINLSLNNFISINPSLYQNSPDLEILDFSKNKFAHLSPSALLALPSEVHINLSSNPFDCSCDLRPFMYWLRDQNSSYKELKLTKLSTYTCSSPVSMSQKPLLKFDPDSITAFCNWAYILIASLSALFLIILTIGSILYRYRWHIRLYWYVFTKRFKKRRRHSGTTYGTIPADEDTYEITISYNEKDKDWVLYELVAGLERWKNGIDDDSTTESDRAQSLNLQCDVKPTEGFLFATGYNSRLNEPEFPQLCDAMMRSKLIIHCISRSYLKSQKNKSEVDMAFLSRQELGFEVSGDEGLFLILLEPGVDVRLPNSLKLLRAAGKFCEWSETEVEKKLFWKDLLEALKTKNGTTTSIG